MSERSSRPMGSLLRPGPSSEPRSLLHAESTPIPLLETGSLPSTGPCYSCAQAHIVLHEHQPRDIFSSHSGHLLSFFLYGCDSTPRGRPLSIWPSIVARVGALSGSGGGRLWRTPSAHPSCTSDRRPRRFSKDDVARPPACGPPPPPPVSWHSCRHPQQYAHRAHANDKVDQTDPGCSVRLHQQSTQVLVARLTDGQRLVVCAGLIDLSGQAQERPHLPAFLEACRILQREHIAQRGHRSHPDHLP